MSAWPKLQPALRILSPIYGLGVALRNLAYDKGLLSSYSSKLPVLCVGNVTVGGSGKTPFVQYLVKQLILAEASPVILLRGYGGTLPGPYVLKGGEIADEVGDEALLHYQELQGEVPIVISRSRVEGAKHIEEKNLGDTIVLDDGFQHRRLNRSLNFLLLDCSSSDEEERWRNGHLLPGGYLRESLSSAIKRADYLVKVHRSFSPLKKDAITELGEKPEIHFALTPSILRDEHSGKTYPLSKLTTTKTQAITAIAKPELFLQFLREAGFNVLKQSVFPDHYSYQEADWSSLEDSTPIVTTTKDSTKLKKFVSREEQLYSLVLTPSIPFEEEQEILAKALSKVLGNKERITA